MKIKSIKAKEILDSREKPTVEVELETDKGVFLASVPSGASTGKNEVLELRDKDGRGVSKAIENINKIIAPKLKGKDPTEQEEIDKIMIELDGTENKSKLGANAILAVSIAVCRAGAKAKRIPLYKYIAKLVEAGPPRALPVPCFNIIEGGVHAANNLDIQEFLAVPQGKSFSGNLRAGIKIYKKLKEILESKTKTGDEGGFAPKLSKTSKALDLIIKAAEESKTKIKIGLDCAASQFYKNDKYKMEDKVFFRDGLFLFYQDLIKKYPIIFMEDPFSQNDWSGFSNITKEFGKNIEIFGDDFLTTNIKRMQEAKEKKACNGTILKPNQIGTITETIEAAKLAKEFGWKIMVSHRSGETEDDFIADLAVGVGADYIKSGAPGPKERMAKYNRLLKIEKEVKKG